MDTVNDRRHRSKTYRPLASGNMTPAHAILGADLCLATGIAIAYLFLRRRTGVASAGNLAATGVCFIWPERFHVAGLIARSGGFQDDPVVFGNRDRAGPLTASAVLVALTATVRA